MPYSDKHKVIFIWIPKTAGSSLGAALRDKGVFRHDAPDKLWGRLPDEERQRWKTWYLQHLPVEGVKCHLPHGVSWEDCFSFGFIRNPWDRMVSFYEYSREARRNPRSVQFGREPVGSFEDWFAQTEPNDQLWYLRDEVGEVPLNFIGRYETLEEDFGKVCETVGVTRPELPKIRSSKRGAYRDYYDMAMRKRVAEKYAEEIDLFKYVF